MKNMLRNSEQRPHVEARSVNRVSSAVWPVSSRKRVATGRRAQLRRDWIMQRRCWVILANVLSPRVLLPLTMLLVVVSSVVVAIVGLGFWFLLLLPLVLFAALLLVPIFLAKYARGEIAMPGSASHMEQVREAQGNEHILSFLTQELRSHPGLLALDAPSTPMPTDQPLVRVLETYDLRQLPVEHVMLLNEETGKHTWVQCKRNDFWEQIPHTRLLDIEGIPYSQPGIPPLWEEQRLE